MVDSSLSVTMDGLLQAAAVFFTSLVFYFFIKLVSKNKFESNLVRTISVVVSFICLKVAFSTISWSSSFVVLIGLLFFFSFIFILGLLQTRLLPAIISAAFLVILGLGMENGTAKVSKHLIPNGPTLMEYLGLTQVLIQVNLPIEEVADLDSDSGKVETPKHEEHVVAALTPIIGPLPPEEEVRGVETESDKVEVPKAEEQVAVALIPVIVPLPPEEEVNAGKTNSVMSKDFLAEFKEWMVNQDPEEREVHKKALAAFLSEQGVIPGTNSVASGAEAAPVNVTEPPVISQEETNAIVIPKEDLLADQAPCIDKPVEEEVVPEIVEVVPPVIAEEALPVAEKTASVVVEEVAPVVVEEAPPVVVEQAAPVVVEKAAPVVVEKAAPVVVEKAAPVVVEKAAPVVVEKAAPVVVEEAAPVVVKKAAPVAVEEPPDPFIQITTHLGVVLVPDNEELMHEWIAVANNLRLNGFVSLGDELVILCTDGTMVSRGDNWICEDRKYIYHFRVEDIMKDDRVRLKANGRELIHPEFANE